jgi:DNA (cytosine-5)-methyltransferase 1
MLTVGSLFSGLGGLELGLEWAGIGPVVWQVEIDPFRQSVLKRHWPDAHLFEDVHQAKGLPYVGLICGGFPCQDLSSSGKKLGLSGSRSGLWNQMAGVIEDGRPEWVVVENVASGANKWVDEVCGDLEQIGYGSIPIPLEARYVGLPHRRKRVFVVAHTYENRCESVKSGWLLDRFRTTQWTDSYRCGARFHKRPEDIYQPGIQRGPNGISARVANRDLGMLGDSCSPQMAEVVGWIVRELSDAVP